MHRKTELAAWLIILTIVAGLVVLNARRRNAAGAADPLSDLRLKLLAQELIGVRSLALGTPKASDAQMTRLIEQMDKETRKPEDKLRAAILVRYLQGGSAAEDRLDLIAKSNSSPEIDSDIATLLTIFNGGVDELQPGEADRLVRRYGYFGRM